MLRIIYVNQLVKQTMLLLAYLTKIVNFIVLILKIKFLNPNSFKHKDFNLDIDR